MRHLGSGILGALGLVALLASHNPAGAQTAPGAGRPAAPAPMTSSPPAAAAKPAREPTAGQMAARERQRKCGTEWRDAKAGGKTGGLKWPQYYSQCNARLKGSHV